MRPVCALMVMMLLMAAASAGRWPSARVLADDSAPRAIGQGASGELLLWAGTKRAERFSWLPGAVVPQRSVLPSYANPARLVGASPGARASPTGSLSQLSGRQGCISDLGRNGCTRGRGLHGAHAVSASPDGRNLYVASTNAFPGPGSLGDSVAVFRRAGPRGALEQLAGPAGCVNRRAAGGCARGRALDVVESVSVSPDGRNVYVTAPGPRGGVAVFARDAATGALTQLPAASGCVSAAADPTPGCAVARGLANELSVVLTADGRFAYLASEFNAFSGGGIAAFARDPNSGALTQLSGSAGSVSASALEGCAPLRGLTRGAGALALSPDGKTLYATAPEGAAGGSVAAFARDSATGALAQLPGRAACVNRSGRRGCARARGLTGAVSVAVSADGRHTFVAGDDVAVFSRSARTGALRQSKGRAACIGRRRRDRCAQARGGPGRALALSADGRNLYALGDGVASFARNARSGALHQLRGRHGCIAVLHTCRRGRALDLPFALTLSPDGASVYVAAFGSGAIAVLSRRVV